MKLMSAFGHDNDKDVYTDKLGLVKIIRTIGTSSSCGQLRKWKVQQISTGKVFYLKSSTISYNGKIMYECESECIASLLAKKISMGDVISYQIDRLHLHGQVIKVCSSEDFVGSGSFVTFAEFCPEAVQYSGIEKFRTVVGALPQFKWRIEQILLFDIIIANTDRHLNNLALLFNGQVASVPLFDCGASMFSNVPDEALKLALKTGFNYQKCRPFFNIAQKQLELVEKNFFRDSLYSLEIDSIVNGFLAGKRAVAVANLLKRNIKKVGEYFDR